MHDESYKHMVLAVACEIPNAAAYQMLLYEYLDEFTAYYRQIKREKSPEECPSALDALISFTIVRLPAITEVDTSVLYNLKSRRSNIIRAFLFDDTSTLITRLASRREIMQMIRKHLARENNHASMYSKINDTRVSAVFTDFLEVFKVNCAHAFQFNGTFQEFVMHSFIQFYYKGRKKDIWAMIRESDDARRELEQNIVTERTLPGVRHDDLKIHDLLVNISVVNDLMFKHSGQSDDARGVQYDIYYLILWELCAARVKEINEAMGEEALVMVDPYDRKELCLGLPPNKGIFAKVQNAKELIPRIFSYVRDGRLNISGLADLRDQCFVLGKHDREGRNCVWQDVQAGGETSHYLDTDSARKNYDVFNKLVKGVISVYTMMVELERRGYFLVNEYRPDLFQDKDVIRYMDYFSSVEHIALIKELQAEQMPAEGYSKNLLTFPAMVDTYAGSAVNNHANIRENRYSAVVYGFLKNPKIKQDDVPNTDFAKLKAIAMAMNAIPHTFTEYALGLPAKAMEQYVMTNWVNVPVDGMAYGRYYSLYYNYFLRQHPGLADYYLRGNERLAELGMPTVPDFKWCVGTADYSGVQMMGCFSVYLPIDDKFYFYAIAENLNGLPFTATWKEIEQVYNERKSSGNVAYEPYFGPMREIGPDTVWFNKMKDSVGFPVNIGINNLGASDVRGMVDKFKIYGGYKRYVNTYYDWMNENSLMQHSIIEVLRTMYVQCLSWASNKALDTGIRPAQAENLLRGLSTGVFDEETLEWFLEQMYTKSKGKLVDLEWRPDGKKMERQIDCTVLKYCFGDATYDARQNLVYKDCLKLVETYKTPAKRFIAIYNHVCTKIEFLTLLRDSFSLLLTTVPTEMPTLVCELNSRFEVLESLLKYTFATHNFGIRLTSDSTDGVKNFVIETRERCVSGFRSLITSFKDYVRSCESDIASLVSYNITSQADIASRFTSWGTVFALMEPYESVPEFEQLKKVGACDAAGFYLYGGKYFCGRGNNNVVFYVHKSGRLLSETNGQLNASDISPMDERNKGLYRDILARGFSNAR